MEKNIAQEEVIQTVEGQLIVIACPGSGKTTTLVRRIHHMTAECNIDSANILMITFTSAAAKEMKERYQKMYGKDQVTFCTIHALCMAILRKFRSFSNDSILSDAKSFFYDTLRGNKKINAGDKEEFIKSLQTDISVLKNSGSTMDEFSPTCCEDKVLFEELYQKYEDYKEQCGLVDFDDMLLQAYDCMKHDAGCLSWLRDKYRYIQVDEYQDTNFLQRDIVYLLAGDNGNLTVVGDDDQSIYGFRGARPEVMLKFQKQYPDANLIRMNTNYRSCKEIIRVADNLIKKNTQRYEKDFLAFHEEMGTVEWIKKSSRQYELLAVVSKVKALIENGTDPSSIAVLFRTNQQAEAVANLLMGQKIPFVSAEKIPSRYQHWMFEDIKSYHKLAKGENWTKKDLARVLNHPQRFLTDYEYIRAGLDERKMRSIAFTSTTEAWKRGKALDNVIDFFSLLNRLHGVAPEDFLLYLRLYGRYMEYLKEYAEFRNVDLQELLGIWKGYLEDAKVHNDWIEWGKYIVQYNKALEAAQNNKKGVVLSTMHCSKGLEWEHVFIIDAVDGVCPYVKAEDAAAIEEERRLFYVAMTRAKEHLYLYSYEENNGKKVNPSPFLLP